MFYLYINKNCFLYQLLFIAIISVIPIRLLGQTSLNVEMLDNWYDNSLVTNSSLARYNECWGFVHNDKEYAIIGSTEGTHFLQITDNNKLIQVDTVLARYASPSVIHRDYKIYQNYAYMVCDEGNSSLQIIDLSYLPDSVHKVTEIRDEFTRVHNLFIDENNALLYACSINTTVAGVLQGAEPMQVFSLSDPLNPQLLFTGPIDIPTVHDAYVRDNIAYLNCGYDGLRVYDFSDPSNPVYLQNLNIYQDQGYNHQGWLTPNGKTYIFGDETEGKKIKKCSVASNHQLTISNTFETNYEEGTVAHNMMASDEFVYVAYYTEGLRIFDLRHNVPKEIAFFDTYPPEDTYSMYGAWGVYSDLPSGRIIVSDRQYGLFLLDFNEEIFLNQPNEGVSVYPNPALESESLKVTVIDDDVNQFEIKLFDLYGNLVFVNNYISVTYAVVPTEFLSGVYMIEISYLDYLDETVSIRQKVLIK